MIDLRQATVADAPRLASLHAERISEGFLPSLGPRFMMRLYRRIARSRHAFAYVAAHDGRVLAFAAASTDVRGLYKDFARHEGVVAGLVAAPRLAVSARKVLETLRYPGATAAGLPAAEILAVATDADAGGRGLGSAVVRAATDELVRRGCASAKVVTGGDNAAARRMYERCGFAPRASLTLHDTTVSQVLVWSRS